MRITHYTVTHNNGRPLPDASRALAATSPTLQAKATSINDADHSVVIDDDMAVALAAGVASYTLIGQRSADPADRRATLYTGEEVIATATALEHPRTAMDYLKRLSLQIEELERRRLAVLQITDPPISRVPGSRTNGVSDRAAAAVTGYSHTQIAEHRNLPLAPEAARWRALHLLTEAGIPLGAAIPSTAALNVSLWERETQTPRAYLTTAQHDGLAGAHEAAELITRAVEVLQEAGLTVSLRRTNPVTYAGTDGGTVNLPEYWIT
ncbi:hypothetical protein OG339_47455 (plasmid) [Streptosporangium sp. NBC_01495]|uniref:hypothetical protein n=1 Tax=Streptosporangium sp. NBC_01495 TaxID=2903899 RepID=UPI002E337124|nr:hypothetical protein [Streptosporangium sp. NBC_01495]